jgi:hypothetical protein
MIFDKFLLPEATRSSLRTRPLVGLVVFGGNHRVKIVLFGFYLLAWVDGAT